MRLYHFINKKYGLESLNLKRLKIAQIDQLNDPFELLGVELSNPQYRDLFNQLKQDLSKDIGILCFCANYHNPALWAHYAEKHKGLCLGFDVPLEACQKVRYSETRLSIDEFMDNQIHRSNAISTEITSKLEQHGIQGEIDESYELENIVGKSISNNVQADDEGRKFMMKCLSTKFSHWSYEEEYRVFVGLNTQHNGLYFMDYSDELILKQVIAGLNSSVLRSEIEQMISGKCEVEIFKVRKDYCEFKMVRDENF